MYNHAISLIFIVSLYIGFHNCLSQSRFTNVQCKSFNESICSVEHCRLKVLKRGIIGASVHIKMRKLPLTNLMINWSLWRKYSGYRPFLYNVTEDFCKLSTRKNKLSFTKVVYEAVSMNSNLNHTCPFNHDIIVDNMVFSDDFMRLLPLPTGDYKFQLRFRTDNIWGLEINSFISRVE